MHSINDNIIIGTQKSVYRNSCLGNLDKIRVSETLRFPLQDRFYSDSKRCFSITIYNLFAFFTYIQRVITGMMTLIHCTAMSTPFRCMIWINFMIWNFKQSAIRQKEFFKLCIRNSADFSICFLVKFYSFNIFQVFKRNTSVIRFCKCNNFFSNLSHSCVCKIVFLSFQLFQAFPSSCRTIISKILKITSPFKKSFLSWCNVFSKIHLFNNIRCFCIKDRNSKAGANINSKNISLINIKIRKFFIKNNSNLTISQKRNIIKSPTIIQKRQKPFKLSILFNRYCKCFSWRICNLKTWVFSFCHYITKPPFIQSDRTSTKFKGSIISTFNHMFFHFPRIFSCFLHNITWQKGVVSYV